MSPRRSVIVAFVVGLVAVVATLVRTPRPAPVRPASAPPAPAPRTPVAEHDADVPPRDRWRWLPVALATGLCIWSFGLIDSATQAAITLGTAAVVCVAIGLRGPRGRHGWPGRLLLAICGVGSTSLVAAGILLSADPADGDIHVLVVSALCSITAVAAVAWSVSTWGVSTRLLEPVALIAVAAILGGVSLTGLYSAGTTIEPVDENGYGELFFSMPGVDAELEVSTITPATDEDGPLLHFYITTNATPPVRWALVLAGTAKVRADTVDGDVDVIRDGPVPDESDDNYAGPPQLVVGGLADGEAWFTARLWTSIGARSASRTNVVFPAYRSAFGFPHVPESLPMLQSELGQNVLPPASLTVEVDAGSLTGLETVTQADPPLTDSRTLRWVMPGDQARPVSYATVDQTAEDVARNKFFAIAIFLGTAAACLVAAMQSVLNRR